MGDMAPNFFRSEFACKDGCGLDSIDPRTVQHLQTVRDKLGEPVFVTSGCRCKRHNAAVGGAPDSQHLPAKDRPDEADDPGEDCTASDIAVRSMAPHELAAYIETNIPEFENGGIGIYPSWVHVDLGPKRRW